MQDVYLPVTVDASGDGTATSPPLNGLLYAVEWIDGNLADGVDGTFTVAGQSAVARTFLTLTDANADATYYPREIVHDSAGAEMEYADGYDQVAMPILSGIVTLTIASGGNATSGGAILHVVEA